MSWYRFMPESRFFGASQNEGESMSDASVTIVTTTLATVTTERGREADAGTAALGDSLVPRVETPPSAPPTAVGVPGTPASVAAAPAPLTTAPVPGAAANKQPLANTGMSRRFRGFLPVVIDVETGGFDVSTHALLEIAAVMIDMQPDGTLKRGVTHSYHVRPFEGSRLDPAALAITGIDPFHPLRPALPEKDALGRVFREIRHAIHAYNCRRAILVGHNAAFDLAFLNAAIARAEVKRNPFHPFSCFDTATLAGAALGQTVLAKALAVAGLE
jgi:ribonuclease T